jgi:RHS repeat-associated protein
MPADGTSTRYKFTGKERDTESGLDYFGARYYGSNMGRFMSPDWSPQAAAVPYASLSNPQSLNLYAYMRNNPLGGTDPDGHCAVANPVASSLDGCDPFGGHLEEALARSDAYAAAYFVGADQALKAAGVAKQIKRTFYKDYGLAFSNAVQAVFGKDAAKVLPQTLANAPKLDLSESMADMAKIHGQDTVGGNLPVYETPALASRGSIFIASDLVKSGDWLEVYKTYGHELANLLDVQVNGWQKLPMEQTYGNPKDRYGDPDTGEQVEEKMFP